MLALRIVKCIGLNCMSPYDTQTEGALLTIYKLVLVHPGPAHEMGED